MSTTFLYRFLLNNAYILLQKKTIMVLAKCGRLYKPLAGLEIPAIYAR